MSEKSHTWTATRGQTAAAHVAEQQDQVLQPLAEVSSREGSEALARRLLELRTWLSDDLSSLESMIDQLCQQAKGPEGDISWRAAGHLLEQAGKRIRPICVLLASRFGADSWTAERQQQVRQLAVAVELVHAATLLHDDVIDEGTERRGALTSRMVYSNSASILAGDQLFVEALSRVESAGRPELLRSLLLVIGEMIAAEAKQLQARGTFEGDRERYLEVLHGKTAALFRWGLEAGAVMAGLSESEIEILRRVGVYLGMAFQLVDDVLDFDKNSQDIGKDVLSDLKQGKLTWPLILACEQVEGFKAALIEAFRTDSEEAMRALIPQVRDCGAIESTREFAQSQADLAARDMAQLPASRVREALMTVIAAAVRRAR